MRKPAGPVLLLTAALAAGPALAAVPAPGAIALRTVSKKELPSWIKVAGTFDRAIGWTDQRGQNIVLFTSRESTRKNADETLRSYALTVEHLVQSGGQVRTVRTVRDLVEKCELDLVGRVVPNSITVTDVDNDGAGEVTFAYELGCRSDMSPDTLKLLVLQGETKYILRGETVVKLPDDERRGGKYTADPPEAQWPQPLLDHAKKMWQVITR